MKYGQLDHYALTSFHTRAAALGRLQVASLASNHAPPAFRLAVGTRAALFFLSLSLAQEKNRVELPRNIGENREHIWNACQRRALSPQALSIWPAVRSTATVALYATLGTLNTLYALYTLYTLYTLNCEPSLFVPSAFSFLFDLEKVFLALNQLWESVECLLNLEENANLRSRVTSLIPAAGGEFFAFFRNIYDVHSADLLFSAIFQAYVPRLSIGRPCFFRGDACVD